MLRFRYGLISLLIVLFFVGVLSAGTTAQQGNQPRPTFTPTPTHFDIPEQFALPLTSDVTYIVQPRDTLDQIAALFDVRLGCIRETNDLRPADILEIGQAVVISAECPAYDGVLNVPYPREDAPGRTGTDGSYVVRPNDTLDTIGQRLNVSSLALAQANDIRFGRELKAGDVLVIPEDVPPYGVYPALEDSTLETRIERAGDDSSTYVVQPNDTLDTIGQRLNVSVVDLLQSNDLRAGRDLRAGFTLVIPADAAPYGEYPALDSEINAELQARIDDGEVSGETYVIQPNDTLDVIAQEYNVSVVAIRLANGIDSINQVRPGRLIVIPDDAPPYGLFPAIGEPAGDEVASGTEYVIQPGDTIDHIAAQFNVDTLCVIERNAVRNVRLIQPGQTIGIPSDCPAYSGYDVVPDTPPQ